MAVVIPYVKNSTWADGSVGGTPVTAAKLNILEDGLANAHQMPAVRVFHNAAQSIATATVTTLAFNSERFDTAGGAASTQHDTVTNNSRLTCRYAGKYMIIGTAAFAGNVTGARAITVRLNGTTDIAIFEGPPAPATESTILTVSTLYDLAVNDYVELRVYQTSGGALNVSVLGNYSPEFSMVRAA